MVLVCFFMRVPFIHSSRQLNPDRRKFNRRDGKLFQTRRETNSGCRGLKRRSKPRWSQAMSEPRIEPYNPPAIGSRAAWAWGKTNYEDQTYFEVGLYACGNHDCGGHHWIAGIHRHPELCARAGE